MSFAVNRHSHLQSVIPPRDNSKLWAHSYQYKPVKIIDVELSSPLDIVEMPEGYDTLLALIRFHGSPLGYIHLPLFKGYDIADLSASILKHYRQAILNHMIADGMVVSCPETLQLSDLVSTSHPVFKGPFPLVTVVVCTRDRTPNLTQCLDSLCHLDYPALEILVIDNAPSNNATEQLVYTYYPNARYICEPRPGLSWARNRAIIEAQGEIIAYTDDDVVVDSGWVGSLVKTFVQDPEVMAVTGLVVPYELETISQILFELYSGFGRGFEQKRYRPTCSIDKKIVARHQPGTMGAGANMAYRRSLFDHIELFDTALGSGTESKGGEDLEMFFRIIQEGYTLVYEPDAIVRHRHRSDYASLRTQIIHNGMGCSAYLMRSASIYPTQYFFFIRFGVQWLWQWHILRLVASLARQNSLPPDLILAELWGSCVGLFRYPKARRVSKRIAQSFGPIAREVDSLS